MEEICSIQIFVCNSYIATLLYRSFILNLCIPCRFQFIFFLVHCLVLTLALVLAARKQDPRNYDEGVDIFRGMCEGFLIIFTLYTLVIEIYQWQK